MFEAEQLLGLGVALGAGLLIGLERERSKRRRGDTAGLRSFAVVALIGALAQRDALLLAAAALLVGAIAALSFWRNARAADPGMTTELALFATLLIGVLAIGQPALAAACVAALALLLSARRPLHRFAQRWLTQQELEDGLMLTALALIGLPLIPEGPIAALPGISLRPLALLVLLILGMQALGAVALRHLGAHLGLLLSALVGGFASSTATIASLGSRAREAQASAQLLARAAALSTVATWLQALLMCAWLAPAALGEWLAPALSGALATSLVALLGRKTQADAAPLVAGGSALRPRVALGVALLIGAVTWATAQAHLQGGRWAMLASVALGGLADAHAPIASLAALQAAGRISTGEMGQGLLVAMAANSLTRALVAAFAGGPRFAARVASAMGAGWLVAVLSMQLK